MFRYHNLRFTRSVQVLAETANKAIHEHKKVERATLVATRDKAFFDCKYKQLINWTWSR